MAMVVIQTSGTGISTILISMILKPLLYVVVVVSGAQTACNGMDGKNITRFNALLADFHIFFQNWYQHSTLRGVFMPSFLAGKDREDKTGKQAYL